MMLARTASRPAARLAAAATPYRSPASRPLVAPAAARDEASSSSSSSAASAALTLGLLATFAALEPGAAHAAAQQHGGPALGELAESVSAEGKEKGRAPRAARTFLCAARSLSRPTTTPLPLLKKKKKKKKKKQSDFWANVARYASFFFSVLLGTAATAVKPVLAALRKSPASAAGVLAVAGLTLWAVSATVSLMLGVGEGGSGPDDLGAFLESGL
jgi:hypothetical protein